MRASGRSGMARQLEPESGTAALAVLEADAALHHLDQALADGEAEARAALLPRGGRIGLIEAPEDARPERLGDAGAAIVHRDAQPVGELLSCDLHHLAFGRELGGVGEEVR